MQTLRAMERQMDGYRKQCYERSAVSGGFVQQIRDEQLHNRIEEALFRCSLENEVLVRKVYLEGRPLVGLSRKEQRKRKKGGLRQCFDCFCL